MRRLWTLRYSTQVCVRNMVLCLQLISGSGEVFGTELAVGKVYTLSSQLKIAVFSWYGCTLRISSNNVLTLLA